MVGLSNETPSAASTLNLRVQPLQFGSGVVDLELPVHAALFGVGRVGPGPDLRLQQRQFADAASAQALAREATPLAFGDIQPTAVFGRVAKVDPLDIPPRSLGRERRVERPFRVCVLRLSHTSVTFAQLA
jgi:hypothetical protein